MTVTEKFTLIEFDTDPTQPARHMWVLIPPYSADSFKADETDLDTAQNDYLDHDGDANTPTTTLGNLQITTFDNVIGESLRSTLGGNEPAGLDAAIGNFLQAAKVLTEMGLDVVAGYKTNQGNAIPPISIRAGR